MDIRSTWNLVINNMRIPYDPVRDMYLEYDNFEFEYPICPVDVVLLAYPLQIMTSKKTLRNTMEYFSPEPYQTCDENPGMTECIHLSNWLDLEEFGNAEYAFNRSKHAACYGPFNVRNEVDLHGHGGIFINSHFLTGEGGFLQAMVNGWGGIRINEDGIRLNPHIPNNVTRITFSKIHYMDNSIRMTFDSLSLRLDLVEPNPSVKLFVKLQNGDVSPLVFANPLFFPRTKDFMPAYITTSR